MPRSKRYGTGDIIAFRIPSDIGESEMGFFNAMKREKKRKFTAYLTGLLFEKIREEMSGENSIIIPLPSDMTEEERKMIANPAFRNLLGVWVHQLAQGKQSLPPAIVKTDGGPDGGASTAEQVEKSRPALKTNPFLQNLKRSTLDDE